MNTNTILAVDDEPVILRSYTRNLGEQFNLLTADSPATALELLRENPVAVILSDLKMPGMDGVSFLRAARELRPETVRMMISGHADLDDAINSVNNAGIFRLMLKPCPDEQIAAALTAGLEQYRLIVAEKELLEGTLNGAIQTLTDILGIMDGAVYGKAQLRRRLAREVAIALKEPTWTFEIAALLAEIGRATLPPALNQKLSQGQALNPAERRLVERVPEFSSRLLQNIPRIEAVARAVLYQAKRYNGAGFPDDGVARDDIPVAARMLHAVNALLDLVEKGTAPAQAIEMLKQGPEHYDPKVVMALYPCVAVLEAKSETPRSRGLNYATVSNLEAGMVLRADIVTTDGTMILAAGARLTQVQVQRVRNFAQIHDIVEPILVEMS